MRTPNIKKKSVFITVVAFISVVCLSTVFFIWVKPLLSSVKMEYTLKPDSASDKTLGVGIRIKRKTFLSSSSFIMGNGNFTPNNTKCVDNNGKPVLFNKKGDKLVIGPVGRNVKYIDLSYKVKIGDFDGNVNQGAYYDDLIAFSGDNTLYFPYFNYEDGSYADIKRQISEITIKADVKEGMKAVIPYQAKYNVKQTDPVKIENPDWRVVYNLGKSCYAFANFDELSIKGEKTNAHILIDPYLKSKLSSQTESLISKLYDYYTGLFGKGLENCPIIILRSDPSSAHMVLGGIGGKSLGMSINPMDGNEVKTFSHSLYSAFFDNKINIINLHYQPNLWLMKGMATYYENMSLDYLPDNMKNKFIFGSDQGFRELYTRYIYFRLKEPVMFKISPADEKNALQGQLQFFFYTEAPLVVKNIEDMSDQMSGGKNNIMSYLLKHREDDKIDVGELMLSAVGQNEALFRNYLSGDTIIPYSGIISGKEDPAKIIKQLNDYEKLLCSWIQQDIPIYPYDNISLLNPDKLASAAIAKNVKFASDDTEKMVGAFSPTILLLLEQYKLRADICGLSDINDSTLKYKLLGNETNVDKWNNYIKTTGLDDNYGETTAKGKESK
ncbi:MAG TPA: hypothetical protein VHP38_10055 [Ruminiclostridium sp.]|nr:hypothetical protein [Ruminiclostridium sp.]